ncbi:MAG TPA: 6-carboxytetrahydropterin synthase [Candidatus Krumholzibacteria bacterium]|nr:6-carboxytetrahydropterin synthase [Candidatus Krumholzibacteria bacterium]
MRVGRIYRFEASHRLHTSALAENENVEVYGKCANEGGHGHNYELVLLFEGEPDPITGMLFDRRKVDRRVQECLISKVDHRHLDDIIDEVTTGENLARVFKNWLDEEFAGGPRLVSVELVETPRNHFVAS